MADSAGSSNSVSFVGWSITLLISLLLHGILLLLPMPSESQAEESEKPQEEETVKVAKLPSLAPPPVQPPPRRLPLRPQPRVERPKTERAASQAARPPVPRPPAPRPRLLPEPSTASAPQPSSQPKRVEKPDSSALPPTETPKEPAGPTDEELQALRQQELDQIYDSASSIQGAVPFSALGIDTKTLSQPQAFFTEESIVTNQQDQAKDPDLLPYLRPPQFFDNKKVADVLKLLQNSSEWSGLEPAGEYGGGKLFKATRPVTEQTEEKVVFFLSIVQNNVKPTSTYLFFWEKNPNEA
jgi:outer membrane biosynthesis protein TonB